MVFVQILAFGQVSENRIQRKSARARKLEERVRKAEIDATKTTSIRDEEANGFAVASNGTCDTKTNGSGALFDEKGMDVGDEVEVSSSGSDSLDGSTLLETSEEETIV